MAAEAAQVGQDLEAAAEAGLAAEAAQLTRKQKQNLRKRCNFKRKKLKQHKVEAA